MTKRDCDMLIGVRGGMWFAFSNSPAGSAAIREKRVKVGFSDEAAAKATCDAVNLTWEMEYPDADL